MKKLKIFSVVFVFILCLIGCSKNTQEDLSAQTSSTETTKSVEPTATPKPTSEPTSAPNETSEPALEETPADRFLWRENDDGTLQCRGSSDFIDNFEGTIVIPREVDGKIVTTIGDNAFDSEKSSIIIIPDSVTTIESGAFWRCFYLTCVEIPESVTEIDDLAFWNSGEDLVIKTPAGSYAEQYAIEHEIPVETY